MKDVKRTTEAPDDKLGKIAEWLTTTFDHVTDEDVHMILMLKDKEKSLVVLSNYDRDQDAAVGCSSISPRCSLLMGGSF
jgi:hypothetical protein